MRRALFVFGPMLLLVVGAMAASAAPSNHTRDTLTYGVSLDASAVVPRHAVRDAAGGTFTARLLIVKGRPRAWLAWKLTLSGFPDDSAGVEAHIHRGRPGHIGAEVVELCSPCPPRMTGSTTLPTALAKVISGSDFWPGGPERAYVDVHTRRNPLGELRGAFVAESWRGDYPRRP